MLSVDKHVCARTSYLLEPFIWHDGLNKWTRARTHGGLGWVNVPETAVRVDLSALFLASNLIAVQILPHVCKIIFNNW